MTQYEAEVVALFQNGSAKSFMAERYGVSERTLYNFIVKHKLDVQPRPFLEARKWTHRARIITY